jgi:ankyrin repeat protein
VPDNSHGISPLGTACEDGHYKCARVLLEARADVNGREYDELKTFTSPLMLASHTGNKQLVELLLSSHADPMIKLQNVDKGEPATPLEFAEDTDEPGGKECATAIKEHLSVLEKVENMGKLPWLGKDVWVDDTDEEAPATKDVAVELGLKNRGRQAKDKGAIKEKADAKDAKEAKGAKRQQHVGRKRKLTNKEFNMRLIMAIRAVRA